MMEQLTPPERAVFVLHEAFDLPHAAIADVLDISSDGSRQHLRRARVHVKGCDRRFDPEPAARCVLFQRFLGALETGELDELQDVLTNDAVAYSDGGGKARAARHPIVGADKVIAFFGALRRHRAIHVERTIEVNGQPGALLTFGQQYQLLTVDSRGDTIHEIHSIMNPDKLTYLHEQLTAAHSPSA
ncbi:sigma factor-like helix-turn-helix DNA-binding protein [Ilumatobacter sp.]|uniref:sigma factor-like helix-turn-helix DNA-binding protein n=1 Tax=Ilumatobacter sp. TaxID=1967498 RepID=UPI003C61779D